MDKKINLDMIRIFVIRIFFCLEIEKMFKYYSKMFFSIRNVNQVYEADIKLNGLTVIVGENSSGKSTVGRLLFSTIQALKETDEKNTQNKATLLNKNIDSLYRRLASIPNLQRETLQYFPQIPKDFFNQIFILPAETDFYDVRLNYIDSLEISPRIKNALKRDLRSIQNCQLKHQDRATNLTADMQFLIESEFIDSLTSFGHSESQVSFDMESKNETSFSCKIKDSTVTDVMINEGDFLSDVTYIESPLYIHILDSLIQSSLYRELEIKHPRFKAMIPAHIADYASKIDSLKLYNTTSDNFLFSMQNELEIEKIVNGHFAFNTKSRSIVFKNDKSEFSPINVASGIKSFGTLQMLLDAEYLNENKMLIWDEPENHLHPKWQVDFAKILVELSKEGIPVLVTTHSPYFLQAIRYFSAKYDIEKYVSYYNAVIQDNSLVKMVDVSNDLNDVFFTLAEPLNKIMNIDEVRKYTDD